MSRVVSASALTMSTSRDSSKRTVGIETGTAASTRSPTRAPRPEALGVSMRDVVVYVGPKCHFVQYPLGSGEMLNPVAVFESPRALAGEQDWGTPHELDAAFADTCDEVRAGLPLMWRDRWWRWTPGSRRGRPRREGEVHGSRGARGRPR
jgi:hypothetical protein